MSSLVIVICRFKSRTESMSADWMFLCQLDVVNLLTDSMCSISRMLRVCDFLVDIPELIKGTVHCSCSVFLKFRYIMNFKFETLDWCNW